MNNFKKIIIFPLLISIFFSGCGAMHGDVEPTSSKNMTININVQPSTDKFETKLIDIAKVSETKYNQYIELLTTLKKKKVLKESKIPRNMGKRVSFSFDGYALILLKKVAEESSYNVVLDGIRVNDSKIISRDYKDSMVVDILEEISEDEGFDIEIDEKNLEIKVKPSV